MFEKNLPEIEKQILGSVLLDNSSLDTAMQILRPKCFSDPVNRFIYSTMLKMYDDATPIDIITLYEAIKRSGKPDFIDATYISKLTALTTSAANIDFHSKLIYEKWLSRELQSNLEVSLSKIKENTEDVFDLYSETLQKLELITQDLEILESDKSLSDDMSSHFLQIAEIMSSDKDTGLRSETFPTFNRFTGGIQETDFLTIYGEYKQGKTTFALQLAVDFALHSKVPVGIFSLEMNKNSVYNKIFSMRTGFDYQKLRAPKTNKLTSSEFQVLQSECYKSFKDSKIFICDQVLDKNRMKAKMKYWKKKYGIKIFVIDYISLIQGTDKAERRDLEVSNISRYFKLAAKELKTPIIMLSQSNNEGRTAESKGLARDSDFVIYVRKPKEAGVENIKINDREFYFFTEDDFLIQLKHSRHGLNGYFFVCRFVENRFVEMEIKPGTRDIMPVPVKSYYESESVF